MEPLLSQLVTSVSELYSDIDIIQTRIKFAGILSLYDIKPAKLIAGHPDITQKVKLFLASKKLEGLSELTLAGYELELKIFGQFMQRPIEEITTNDIRSFLGQFDSLKLSSISRKLSVLKSFFGWLTEEDLIPKDPTRRIKPPKKEKRLPKALSIEELELLRESCESPRERAILEIFYSSGCRLSEIAQLNKQDINWQTYSTKVVGKGTKEREVFFSFKAIYHLKKYLDTRKDIVPALFITERTPYKRLSNRAIQRLFKKIASRAAIEKNVTPHVMRHTFATLTLNNGADLVTVQELLGHANPGTTQVYAHLSGERKREQYKKHLVQ